VKEGLAGWGVGSVLTVERREESGNFVKGALGGGGTAGAGM